jgi:hypothetical protein
MNGAVRPVPPYAIMTRGSTRFTFTELLRTWCFSNRASQYRLVSRYQLNTQFLYSITIYMLHYNPQHVSSSTVLIFRRSNCIITASGNVTHGRTVCRLRADCSPLSTGVLYGRLQRVTIPDAVIIQFDLLKMSKVWSQYAGWERTAQFALNRHTERPFTESDDSRRCNNTICPPEDEQGTARNMLRIIM